MKTKNLFLLMAAFVLALTGCAKESTGGDDTNGESDIRIQLSKQVTNGVRGIADPVNDGDPIELNEGALFLCDANGAILNYIIISSKGIAGSVSSATLENGYVIKKVKNTAKTAYLVGNYDFLNDASAPYANISDVKDIEAELLLQNDNDNGVANAALKGSGNIVTAPVGATHGAEKEVFIEVTPLIARFEITSIKGVGNIDDGFVLEGIYLNNFYYKVGVLGDLTAAINDYENVPSRYYRQSSPFNGSFLDAWYPWIFDDGGIATGGTTTNGLGTAGDDDANTVYADGKGSGKAWAFNAFAQASADPHIIFHLTNVKISGVPYNNTNTGTPGEAYITVARYLDMASTSTNEIRVPILGGRVYKIGEMEFDEGDIAVTPEPKDDLFDVYVEIELVPWKAVNVKVGIDS